MSLVTKKIRQGYGQELDRELEDLAAAFGDEARWREWMTRVEAVIFASGQVVPRETLQSLVGASANIDHLIADIQAELKGRPYELASVASGWMFRTRTEHADAIRKASEIASPGDNFTEMEMAVLCAIAYHQPIDRDGLAEIFGKDVSRDLISRLRHRKLIANGPRSPRPGAPHTFVTTEEFLVSFDLQSLRDLPQLDDVMDQAADEKQVIFI